MSGTKRPSAVLEALADQILGPMLEDAPPPKKRRGPGKKNKGTVVDHEEDIADDLTPPPIPATPAAVLISYTLSIFTAAQMKKDAKKCGDPKTSVMQLKSDLKWDAFKAKLLVKVKGILKPELLSFGDYRVSFSIACLHPKPTELANGDTYQFMTSHASQSRDPCAAITIEPVIANDSSDEKENKDKGSNSEDSDESGSDSGKRKKKKKKGKKKKLDPSDLPGNKAITREIGHLHQKWQCHAPSCGNGHCYIHPEEKTHFSLGHMHFSVWAAAIVKGDDTATLENPPNHKVFDFIPENAKAKVSLLQRRNAAMNQPSNSQLPIQIFNGMTPEMLQMLCPIPTTPATPLSVLTTGSAQSGGSNLNATLFLPSMKPATPVLLGEFCTTHHLSDQILTRFSNNGFTTLNQLCYITVSDLKEMEFKRGEIAGIQDAIETWSKM